MTPEQLAEIRKRVNKATRKEKWFVHGGTSIFVNWYKNNDVYLAETFRPEWHENRHKADEEAIANAEFIASSRTDVPALLDEVERLREVLRLIHLDSSEGYIAERAHQALEGNHEKI